MTHLTHFNSSYTSCVMLNETHTCFLVVVVSTHTVGQQLDIGFGFLSWQTIWYITNRFPLPTYIYLSLVLQVPFIVSSFLFQPVLHNWHITNRFPLPTDIYLSLVLQVPFIVSSFLFQPVLHNWYITNRFPLPTDIYLSLVLQVPVIVRLFLVPTSAPQLAYHKQISITYRYLS